MAKESKMRSELTMRLFDNRDVRASVAIQLWLQLQLRLQLQFQLQKGQLSSLGYVKYTVSKAFR